MFYSGIFPNIDVAHLYTVVHGHRGINTVYRQIDMNPVTPVKILIIEILVIMEEDRYAPADQHHRHNQRQHPVAQLLEGSFLFDVLGWVWQLILLCLHGVEYLPAGLAPAHMLLHSSLTFCAAKAVHIAWQ